MLGACGASASHQATTPTSSESQALTGPPRPWAELSHDERQAHMVRHVLPATADLFASWDATRFADFSCQSCHGQDAETRAYAMPNPSLLTLYPTGTLGQEQVLAQYREACTFMYSRLVPAMGQLLAMPEYDPSTQVGLTCFACHPRGAESDPLSAPAH